MAMKCHFEWQIEALGLRLSGMLGGAVAMEHTANYTDLFQPMPGVRTLQKRRAGPPRRP